MFCRTCGSHAEITDPCCRTCGAGSDAAAGRGARSEPIRFTAKETPQFLAILGDGLIRELTPQALRLAGLEPAAARLAALPPIQAVMIGPSGDDQVHVAACRAAHTAVLHSHRNALRLLGSEQCRMTDADLLTYTGASGWTDPRYTWRWPYGPAYGSTAAALAYATLIRAIAVLHLWGQDDKAHTIGAFLDATTDAMCTRAFLECDEAYLLTPGNPHPRDDPTFSPAAEVRSPGL